jgi:MFS family permease
VLLILERRVPESRDESAPSHIDVAGATLATLGLGLLIYGLISLQESFDWRNVSAVVLGVITLIGFLFVEARSPGPMMRLDLFSSRVFSGTNLYTFLLYAALGGSLYFVPFYLINIHGYSPAAAGAALLPTLLLIFGFSRFSGGLVPRIGARPLLIWGALLAAAGFVAYGLIGVGGSYWTTFFPAAVLLGLGGACFVAPLTTAVMESVPPQHAGIASGVNNAIARAAGLVAIAVLGIILAVAFNARFDAGISHEHLSSATANAIAANRTLLVAGRTPATITDPDRARVVAHVNDAYASGFRAAMFVSAALAASAALVAFVMLGPARVRAATASAS